MSSPPVSPAMIDDEIAAPSLSSVVVVDVPLNDDEVPAVAVRVVVSPVADVADVVKPAAYSIVSPGMTYGGAIQYPYDVHSVAPHLHLAYLDSTLDTLLSVNTMSVNAMICANPRILFVVLMSTLGGLLFGYDIGIIGGVTVLDSFRTAFALPLLKNGVTDTPSSALTVAWIVSSFTLGCAVAAFFAGWLSDVVGRKRLIVIGAVIFTAGGVIQGAAYSVTQLIIGRVIAGIAVGILSMVVPIYISELAPRQLRGLLGTLQQLAITFGILLAFLVNLGFSTIPVTGFRYALGFQILFSLALAFGGFFLPESPRWLMMSGADEVEIRRIVESVRVRQELTEEQARMIPLLLTEAARTNQIIASAGDAATMSSSNVTAVDADALPKLLTSVDAELAEMRISILSAAATATTSTYEELFTLKYALRLVVGSGIQVFQQLTGVNAIFYYLPTIASNLNLDALSTTAISGVVNFASTFVAIPAVDRVGRVPLMMFGAIGMLLASIIITVLTYGGAAGGNLGIAVLVLILIFIVNFAYSWGPCGWIIPAEIFPLHIRSKAVGVTTSLNWFANFAIAQAVPPLLAGPGLGATFLMFSIFLAAIVIWTACFVAETRGVSLERMESIFNVTTWPELYEYIAANLRSLYVRGISIGASDNNDANNVVNTKNDDKMKSAMSVNADNDATIAIARVTRTPTPTNGDNGAMA